MQRVERIVQIKAPLPRLSAYNMLGKLLWAEGRTDEALARYAEAFPDRYTTVGQKSEQRFAEMARRFLHRPANNLHYRFGDVVAEARAREKPAVLPARR